MNIQKHKKLILDFLSTLYSDKNKDGQIEGLILAIQEFSGIEAVAIRLKEENDYPYYSSVGFSKDFIKLENYLCSYSRDGDALRDKDGHVVLDCMCGSVINGQTDTSLPFFSEGGSFWTNGTTELIKQELPDSWDRKTRNQCNIEGYECVSIIPLRFHNEIIGSLQLNDKRKDLFTLELIEFYEGIGNAVGLVLKNKEMEELLEKQKEATQDYINVADVIILSLNIDGTVDFVNKKTCDVLGYSREEIVGKNWIDNFIPEDMRESLYSVFFKNISDDMDERKEVAIYENTVLTSNGEKRYIRWHNSFIKDDNGKVISTLSSGDDVTELKIQEKKIQEERLRYQVQFEEARDAIFIADVEFGIMFDCNKAATKLIERNKEDIVGQHQRILHPFSENQEYSDSFERHRSGYPEEVLDEKVITKSGIIKDVSIKANIITVEGKKYIQGTFRDITEAKKEEEEKIKIAKELERSNEELEQFAYIASHDLQEPLRTVSSYCQLLEERFVEDIDPEVNRYISYVIDGTFRMKTLIRELLDFSRVGTIDEKLEKIVLSDLIEEVIHDFDLLLQETKGRISIVGELPKIVASRIRIKQLFHNLISNALKFRTRNKIPIIEIGYGIEMCECQNGDCPEEYFYVKDNGLGIENKHFEQIFGIFRRLYTRDQYPGTGIGLAMCKKIVENSHGGKIWVNSIVGEGSCFCFSIPQNK